MPFLTNGMEHNKIHGPDVDFLGVIVEPAKELPGTTEQVSPGPERNWRR